MNFGELFKRAIKYIVEGIIVAIAAYVIPTQRLEHEFRKCQNFMESVHMTR